MICRQQKAHPEGAFIVAGDFNQACLKTVLPKFVQYIQGPTRGKNTLDRVYSNLKEAYRITPLPHLGLSDHISVLSVPAYKPLRRRIRPVRRTVKTWPEGALSQLQDCFGSTEWTVFDCLELNEYTETVLFYIKTCTDNVTVDKQIRVFNNRKPWMTVEVRSLLRARDSAFKAGDQDAYTAARANLKRGIKAAKRDYKRKVENHLTDSNPRQVWQGLQHLTNYKGRTSDAGSADALLAEELR